MRRLFDSMEILSTVSRRLDRYVLNRQLNAQSESEFWSLIHKITDAALVDKVRIFQRLQRVEGADSSFAHELAAHLERTATDSDEIEIELDSLLKALDNDTDRQILSLWLAGNEHRVIGEDIGLKTNAVRVRWHRIRQVLQERIAYG